MLRSGFASFARGSFWGFGFGFGAGAASPSALDAGEGFALDFSGEGCGLLGACSSPDFFSSVIDHSQL
jgi:hypothetical protein